MSYGQGQPGYGQGGHRPPPYHPDGPQGHRQGRPQGHNQGGFGQGGHRPPPGPPPRQRKRRRPGRIVLVVLLVLLTIVGGLWIYGETSLNRTAALTEYEGRPAAGAGTNWLIVGSDSREDLSEDRQKELNTGAPEGRRTDTIMLLHIPDNDTPPTLVSLLRDSYVPIPGKGRNKLNAAYAFGGPELLAKTVETTTGLRMDHYIEIGLGGFADLVDAVGGVEMCLKNPINDPLAGINLKAGCQELSGPDALGYVRTRVGPRADLDRVIRQREFISALTEKATSFGTMINPFRVIPLVAAAPEAVTVDEGDHLHNLLPLALAMGSSDLVTTTVPMGGSERVQGVGSVIRWDREKALRLFDALGTDAAVPADVIVKPPK
ncbi:LCP family protein [Actinokineospora guangxiensis]|uniref:LCP family protein n=1 Tax=Actinokineospora guangxiensis TaxID=1490288 RepID=A0ABW0ETG2_9PSEU